MGIGGIGEGYRGCNDDGGGSRSFSSGSGCGDGCFRRLLGCLGVFVGFIVVLSVAGSNANRPNGAQAGQAQAVPQHEGPMFFPRDGFQAIYEKEGIAGVIGQLILAAITLVLLGGGALLVIGALSGIDDGVVGAILGALFLKKR